MFFFFQEIMETFDASVKIKCLIEMALKGEMTWLALDPVINKLTPTLEKSRQIIRILLKEFETHQSMCTISASNDGDDLLEDITDINDDRSLDDEVKSVQGRNFEKEGTKFTEERQVSEKQMKIRHEEITIDDNEQEFDIDFSEADSEGVEEFDEDDVSKSIQLVETFKGQLYTFVGDESEEKCVPKKNDPSIDHDQESKDKADIGVHFKEPKGMTIRTSYKCETCGKFFKDKTHMNSHVRTHTGEKPYQCRTCTKNFARSDSLKKHVMIHTGERPYSCQTCKKCFVQSSDLTKHERTHTGERPYECKKCKKCFTQISSLSMHEKTHK